MMSGRCNKPVVLFASRAMDVLISTEQTGGAFSLMRLSHPPGYWTQLLRHRNHDETLFVVSGSVRAEMEAGSIDLLSGQALVVARGWPHRIGNVGGAEARVLSLRTPVGFDHLVRGTGRLAGAADHLDPLRREAPHYGAELLDAQEVAMKAGAAPALAAPDMLDMFGVSFQFFVELATGDDELSLMRASSRRKSYCRCTDMPGDLAVRQPRTHYAVGRLHLAQATETAGQSHHPQ